MLDLPSLDSGKNRAYLFTACTGLIAAGIAGLNNSHVLYGSCIGVGVGGMISLITILCHKYG